jgi:DNA-binding NarL/FixJ family response regulator
MCQAATIRVLVIDDHPLLRDGLCAALEAEPDFQLVGQGECYQDALRLTGERAPTIVLLDIAMPGGGIAAAQAIRAEHPKVKVVMLTASENEADVVAALQSGAAGYVVKGVSGPALAEIVRGIEAGRSYVPPSLAARLLAGGGTAPTAGGSRLLAALTHRESQILALLAVGLSNREIGLRLDLREKTVKHYVSIIFQKLQVRNRVEAALLMRQHQA